MRLYKTNGLLLFFFFTAIGQIKSQNSDTFNPLSGSYIIGGSEGFETMNQAIDSLNRNGINGSVLFNIRDGNYEGQFEITSFNRSSNTDTVVFKALSENKDAVVFSHESYPNSEEKYILKLNGCKQVTFKNVFFEPGDENLSAIVEITNGASNNRIEGCSFSGNNEMQDSLIVILDNQSGESEDFNEIVNNTIRGGRIGIQSIGENNEAQRGIKIIGNTVENQSEHAVVLEHNKNGIFKENIISYDGSKEALIFKIDSVFRISKNRIYSKGRAAIYVNGHNWPEGKGTLTISNNMAYCLNGASFKGDSIEDIHMIHNTFVNNTSEVSTVSLNKVDSVEIENNLFFNRTVKKTLLSLAGNSPASLVHEGDHISIKHNGLFPKTPSTDSTFEKSIFVNMTFRDDSIELTPDCGMSDSLYLNENYKSNFNIDINGEERKQSGFWLGAAEREKALYQKIDLCVIDSLDTLKDVLVEVYGDITSRRLLDKLDASSDNQNGLYSFDSLPYSTEYWIRIIPDNSLKNKYLTSYNHGETRWDKGLALQSEDFCSSDTQNITPRKIKEIHLGNYSISGSVRERGGINKMEVTDPIPGLDVVLDKIPPSRTVAITQTDNDGNYSFSNLPEGTYVVSIDYEGLPIDTLYQVKLDENSDSITNLNYCVDTTSQIEGCSYQSLGNKNIEFSNLKVFPNPIGEILNISGVEGSFNVRIVDTRGRNILQVFNKDKTTLISTTNFESGIYFISIKTQNGEHVFKVLK